MFFTWQITSSIVSVFPIPRLDICWNMNFLCSDQARPLAKIGPERNPRESTPLERPWEKGLLLFSSHSIFCPCNEILNSIKWQQQKTSISNNTYFSWNIICNMMSIHHCWHEMVWSISENVLLEGLSIVIIFAEPHCGEGAKVQAEDGTKLSLVCSQALQGSFVNRDMVVACGRKFLNIMCNTYLAPNLYPCPRSGRLHEKITL